MRQRLRSMQVEMDGAHRVLDLYGAPREMYSPYDHCMAPLTVAGRIAMWHRQTAPSQDAPSVAAEADVGGPLWAAESS